MLLYIAFALILGGFGLATLGLALTRRSRVAARSAGPGELHLLGTPGESPMLRHVLARRFASLVGSRSPHDPLEVEHLPQADPATSPSETRRAS
jgi:hypothetical protein